MVSTFSRWGFTLVELLATVAVVAVLAAMLIPAVSGGLKRARDVTCRSNLRTLAQASLLYSADNDAVLPVNGFGPSMPGWDQTYYYLVTNYYPSLIEYRIPASSRGTAFHCPEASATIKPRWVFLGRSDFDYSLSSAFGGRRVLHPRYAQDAMHVPRAMDLNASAVWYGDGHVSFNSAAGTGWYVWEYFHLDATDNRVPWMWNAARGTTVPRTWEGHPGGAANFVMGDGHVIGMSYAEYAAKTVDEKRILRIGY